MSAGPHDFDLILDPTTPANWILEWKMDGAILRAETSIGTPGTLCIGIGDYDCVGTMDNFQLDVVSEPGMFMLLAIGLIGLFACAGGSGSNTVYWILFY